MDNFKVIYKILKLLEEAMDQDEFDINLLSPDLLGVTENHRNGLSGVKLSKPAITLKGLQYLEENSMMKKVSGILKGIKETIPGL